MVDIPFPVSSNPGKKPQEGTGRLINVFVEPKGDGSPVWRRAPGATVFARAPSSGSARLDIRASARSETFFSTFFQLVGSTFATYDSSGDQEFTFSSDVEAGDLLFLAYANDVQATMTTPTGWTRIGTTVDFMSAALFYKISTGEAVVDISIPSANNSVIGSWSIRGAMTTAPIVETAQSTGTGVPAPPNITNTTANSLLMNVSFIDNDPASAATAPTTVTIGGTTTHGMGFHKIFISTGAAGTAATALVGMRRLPTTGAVTQSTWSVTGASDAWVSHTFTVRHD